MQYAGNYMTSLLIGDTGVGKSELGNRVLRVKRFQANDSPFPVTLAPKAESTVIDGVTRYVIDTEGHADGNSISSEQIQKLALFLKQWKLGVNAVCIVLNGQNDRFSQGIKDTLRWAYNTFGTPDVLNHICIVFTCCYDGIARPNRQRKETEYRQCVQQFLRDVSGIAAVPLIPIFFVDSLNYQSAETERNLTQFHGWAMSRQPLLTGNVRAVELRDKIETETVTRAFVRYRFSGSPDNQDRYAVYENRERKKITPHNGDPVRYSEWTTTRTWEEHAGHQTINIQSIPHEVEVKEVDHHSGHSMSGFSRRAHTHYSIKRKSWREQQTITTHFDGSVTRTQPAMVGCVSWRTIESDRERGWTHGYERVII
jgi:hypothetical protein